MAAGNKILLSVLGRIVLWLAVISLMVSGVMLCTREDDSGQEAPGRKKSFGVDVGEEMSVRQHGLYGVDLISCKSCSIEKRKIGCLTIGGFNVLVLKDLSVVLPQRRDTSVLKESANDARVVGKDENAKAFFSALGITDSWLKMSGKNVRFSGLRIEGLKLSTLDSRTNVVARFEAKNGIAERDGLHLSECLIYDHGRTNRLSQALLAVKPRLHLVWRGGEMEI